MALELTGNSPAASFSGPSQAHSRRLSSASATSKPGLELSQALDHIHTNASKSDGLTTFGDYASPRPGSTGEGRGFRGEGVQGGLSGLYTRLKASVGAATTAVTGGAALDLHEDTALAQRNLSRLKVTGSSTVVSPSRASRSATSSRIQSPIGSKLPESSSPYKASRATSAQSRASAPPPGLGHRDFSSKAATSETHRVEAEASPLSVTVTQRPSYQRHDAASGTSTGGGFDVTQPFIMERQDSDAVSNWSNNSMYTDSDQTPRAQEGGRHLQLLEPVLDVRSIRSTDSKDGATSLNPAETGIEKDPTRVVKDTLPKLRPPLLHVSQSHLPGFRASRTNSSDGDLSSRATNLALDRVSNHEVLQPHSRRSGRTHGQASDPSTRLRNKILAKELWMRDENAKDCFYCGDAFSAFRRKHHCRICGNIFDAKCTVLIDGSYFGQSGKLRTCRPCEAIVYGTDDDSSDYTDDDRKSISGHSFITRRATDYDPSSPNLPRINTDVAQSLDNHFDIETPSMGVPMSRKSGGEAKRRSAVIESDVVHTLQRPSSSKSLKSLSGRPRSSSHKRHNSRFGHQHMKSLKAGDDRAPFQRSEIDIMPRGPSLPAFHHDNIIDPDLAPFLSDEESSGDDTSIFTTLNTEPQSPGKVDVDRAGFSSLLASVRRGKPWGSSAVGNARSDADNLSITSRTKYTQRRNLSISSAQNARASPRRTKSNSLLKIPFAYAPSIGVESQSPIIPSPGSRMIRSAAMKGEAAPAVELNQASLQHVRRLLRQLVKDCKVLDGKRWEKALMPILLRCTDDVNPDIQRKDDIDIRHYIKLKKIPGGKPYDTSYLSGVVFSKNLALKTMARSITNPRIAIITFPLEYARAHKHFMSLDPVIAQEREYLRNLVKRIANLKAHVLLVEKNVAGLALDFLHQANIVVVSNVKSSVLNAVARCTQTRLITSPEKLGMDPSYLGRCASFDVKTYVHDKARKTYIYLSGCQPDLGCTIVLRGAEVEQLRKIKQITEFMCYVVYNLKLETCVMRDEYVLIPVTLPRSGTIKTSGQSSNGLAGFNKLTKETSAMSDDTPDEAVLDQVKSTSLVDKASSSDEHNITDRSGGSDLDVKQSKQHHEESLPSSSTTFIETQKSKIISASPFVRFVPPYLLAQALELETRLVELKQMRDKYAPSNKDGLDEKGSGPFELVRPDMVHGLVQRPTQQVRDFLYAVHDVRYEKALHHYNTQKRQFETYLYSNASLLDPFNHQRIAFLYSMVNTKTSTPCVGPDTIALGFYNEHDLEDDFLPDITLGQYVEDLCHWAHTSCTANGCEETMFNHHRQYVHGSGQMSVIVQKFPPRLRGMEKTILMWSICRLCGKETQVMPMSENTWKYSFGKYLELTFWSTPLHPRAKLCPHDIHKDHVRYFGYNNVAIRIQYDAIELNEIIVPRPRITWNVDSDLLLKNDQFNRLRSRLDRFMVSVKARLDSIHFEGVAAEKLDACITEVERLRKKAHEDHEGLTRNLQDNYMNSRYYELIPLNKTAKAMHENSIEWDECFVDFEKNFLPSERDIRRLAQIQINRFLDRDASNTSITSIDESVESDVAETKGVEENNDAGIPDLARRLSTMSPADTKSVLAAVIKDEQMLEQQEDDDVDKPKSAARESIVPGMTITSVEAVDRKDLKHLDLAVSSDLAVSQSASMGDQSTPIASPIKVAAEATDHFPEESSLVLHPQVSRTVDEMREAAGLVPFNEAESVASSAGMESKIPRPTMGMKHGSPPLIRTRSTPQPSLLLRRQTAAESSISLASTASKSERLKQFITDPARVLERRIGPAAFRSSRSASRSLIPRSVPSPTRIESRVLTLRHHFEQLSKEFEKQRMKERQQRVAKGQQQRAYPMASSKPIVEVYRDEHEAVQERDTVDEDIASPRVSVESSRLDEATTATASTATSDEIPEDQSPEATPTQESVGKLNESPPESLDHLPPASDETADGSDNEHSTEDLEVPDSGTETQPMSPSDSTLDLQDLKHEKTSLLKMLTSFWSERSASGWSPLDYPFSANEHVWGDSDIIVREDEPSSLIALALSSPDYREKVRQFRNLPDDPTQADIDKSIEETLMYPKNTNIRYAFQNRGVRAQCKIFFAESFDALRRKTGAADRFVESLSRCLKWDSKGGKTKSIFLKTLDDRFVLKSLSQVEVNAFFKFAPNYFAFMHQNLFHSLPSVIAKMMGLFQVTIRAPGSGLEFNWYMLVMENLFYDRSPNRRFDLKGSMRNRKIQSTGERDEVLLDENLVDLIFEKPIFVREHTWRLLKTCVWNDTLFLSKQNVMDYSLMAGFEDDAKEIIVGIIDCIRTYTWDKKLETWIKDRGKNKPTVTSPRDYRNRFRIAMSKYILQAPNCWHMFQVLQVPPYGGDGGAPRHARLSDPGMLIGNPMEESEKVRDGTMLDVGADKV